MELQEKLLAPFEPLELEWRIQQAGESNGKHWGMVLAYVTNRAIMDRLDSVVGIGNWKNEYSVAPDGGVMCGISLLVPRKGMVTSIYKGKAVSNELSHEWVTKYDGAENTAVEAVKGGLSNAMKRAAVQWGIGRYLYKLETNFVSMTTEKPVDMKGWGVHYDKEIKKRFYWKHPVLPEWALPNKIKDTE